MKRKFLFTGLIAAFSMLSAWSQQRSEIEIASMHQNHLNASALKQSASDHTAAGNQVYIQQVGDGNYAQALVKSQQALVDYRQQGNFNYINFDVQAPLVEHVVHQKGNSNRAFGFMMAEDQSNLQLIQSGNNQHFEQFGSNSIGDKMQVKMSGNTHAVIVRNFQ